MFKKVILLITALFSFLLFVFIILFLFFGDLKIVTSLQEYIFEATNISIPSIRQRGPTSNTFATEESYGGFISKYTTFTENNKTLDSVVDFADWDWKRDLMVAEVISLREGTTQIALNIVLPSDEGFSNTPFIVDANCPWGETYIVLLGETTPTASNVDVLPYIESGDVLYTRCGNKNCTTIETGCVLVKREI